MSKPAWSKVNWKLRRAHIASLLGVTRSTVTRYAKRHSIPEPPNHGGVLDAVPWERVDWTYKNCGIQKSLKAEGFEISRQAVSKARKRFEKPLRHV